MKIKSLKYLIILFTILAANGCKKFVESDNVNVNPNASSQATLKTLLPALIDATATNQYNVAYSTTLFAQQMAAYQAGPINDDKNIDVRMTAFLGLYQAGLTNAMLLIEKVLRFAKSHHHVCVPKLQGQ